MRSASLAFLMVANVAVPASLFAADPGTLPPVSIPSATPAPVPGVVPAPQPPPVTAPAPITAELNDGSKVEFDADNTVWVIGPGGQKTQAPDGTLTLKDGTPFVVREGRRVSGE